MLHLVPKNKALQLAQKNMRIKSVLGKIELEQEGHEKPWAN